MKKPPSASVKPPTQTTQRVPIRSSKPGPGWDAGAVAGMSGIGGGATGWPGGGDSASVVSILIWSDADGAIGASCAGSGGGVGLAAVADDATVSIKSSRARNAAV